jgi:hypothetical protein
MAFVNDPPHEIQIAELFLDGFEGTHLTDLTVGLRHGIERANTASPVANRLSETDVYVSIDAVQIEAGPSSSSYAIGKDAGRAAVRAILRESTPSVDGSLDR